MAGRGELPWLAVRVALERGESVRVFCATDEPPPAEFASISEPVVLTRFYRSVISAMKRRGVGRLLLLGKVTRDILYDNPSFDLRTLFALARMKTQSDYSIFDTFGSILARRGITIIDQESYLDSLFLPHGRYGRKLTRQELEDIAFGMFHARELNRLDIGQCCVVAKKAVMAVEGAEGTDQCIARGGELFHRRGAVVCKVAKIGHDRRFDIPVIGERTLESMQRGGCRVLALESDCTFVVTPSRIVKRIREMGITIVSLDPDKSDMATLKQLTRKEQPGNFTD